MLAAPARVATLGPLTAWLREHGAHVTDVECAWHGDELGVGLVAKRDLPAGAAACSVPRRLLLTATSGLSDPVLGPLLSELVDELEDENNQYDASQACIAMQLCFELYTQCFLDLKIFL